MTDIVYTLGRGSVFGDNELRLSLRSIQKHLKGYRDIYIVGECPNWVQNCIHIPYQDTEKIPDKNIMLKLRAACHDKRISDDFLFFNDDHYLLTDFTAYNFPFYYHKTIQDYITTRLGDNHGKRSQNTLNHLSENGLPDKFFDVHTPIIYNKKAFIENVCRANWKNQGFIIKSLYANSLQIPGIELPLDPKYQTPPSVNLGMMSTYPQVRESMQRFLFEQFPNKSFYEK